MGVYAMRDSRFWILSTIGIRAPPGADVAAALFVRISPRILRKIRRTLFSRSRSSVTSAYSLRSRANSISVSVGNGGP